MPPDLKLVEDTLVAAALAGGKILKEYFRSEKVQAKTKSSYADLSSVWDACRAALSSNGLSVSQHPGRLEDGSATVTTILLHKSGQHIASVCAALPRDQSPAAVGSVVTYLRRYALAAAVGVAPEDDDGQAAHHAAPQAPPQRAPVQVHRLAEASGGRVESVERIAPASSGIDPSCPTCSGSMWDNREKKTNPKAPDFKCRDKNCQGVIWKYGEKPRGPVPQTRGPLLDAPPPPTDEDGPGFPF